MWENAATQRNVAKLRADGIAILGPAAGDQACGEVGMGRMLEPEELLQAVLAFFAPKRLAGRKVIVTAGPTFEAIDTVRGITNLSSGKMGYAVAEAAAALGAEVTLISGPDRARAACAGALRLRDHGRGDVQRGEGARRRRGLFLRRRRGGRLHAGQPPGRKLKKTAEPMEIKLKPTEDILAYVAALPNGPFCVGFAAESENLADYAQAKRARKKIPMIVANLVQHTIGKEENEVTIYDDDGAHALARAPKSKIAYGIVEHAMRLRAERPQAATVTPIKQVS